jgi:ribosomal protein S18 acetylase RimI-like enzyme
MKLSRRPATEADIPFLLALRRETMNGHLAASGIAVDDASRRVRVMHAFDCAELLLADGVPVGLLKLRKLPHEWEIVQVQLAPALQGRGIGRSLLQEILAEAARAGVPVSLSVLKANPAKRLYEELGFEVFGEDAHEFHMRIGA